MPNWCSNRVAFAGDDEAIAKVQELFLHMQSEEEKTGCGQMAPFTDSEDGYFFDLYQNDGDIGIFEYQTRWSPNTAILQTIADRFGLGFTHEYEEMGCCIYGQAVYKDGQLTENDLDWKDFDRYEYQQEQGLYYFEGEPFESDYEILEILLERKLTQKTS